MDSQLQGQSVYIYFLCISASLLVLLAIHRENCDRDIWTMDREKVHGDFLGIFLSHFMKILDFLLS